MFFHPRQVGLESVKSMRLQNGHLRVAFVCRFLNKIQLLVPVVLNLPDELSLQFLSALDDYLTKLLSLDDVVPLQDLQLGIEI